METNTIQDIASKQIKITKQVYLLSPARMFSEFRGEKENVKNYNNRQLLEMLQNADDAASEAKNEKKVLVKLIGNKLLIANTGYPFSKKGLNSIFHSHLSPKEAEENQIGNKGLGFRSILSWADKVTIKSHGLCVDFSEKFSKTVLEELLTNENFNRDFDELNSNHYKSPIATLVCPNIETASIIPFQGMENYDTIIQIDLQSKAIEEVKKQVEDDLDAEVLLFLNFLQKIEIDINGELSGYSKKFISPSIIEIEYKIKSESIKKKWNINTLSGRFEEIDKPYNLSLAWNNNLLESKDVIYTYFRTKVPIKCKGILHGSFELNADRNLIIDDSQPGEKGYNKRLVALLPEFIAQTAEKIADLEKVQVNYNAINFLHFDFHSLSHLLNINDFRNELLTFIKTKNIFPGISNKYLSWNDERKPVYYEEEEFAEYLSPVQAPNLLLCCYNEEAEQLIKSLRPEKYVIGGVIGAVSIKKDQLSEEEYAKFIIVIHKYVGEKSEIEDRKLFYDNSKNLLDFNDIIFLPNASAQYDLPKDLGVQIVSSQLAQELLKITECDNYRSLAAKLDKFQLKEYKFSEVVESLINHFSSAYSTKSYIIDLNRHLFNIYSNEEFSENKWLGTPVPLICKNGIIILANELYFGKEYGNLLTDEIYNYDRGKIVASPKKFKVDEDSYQDWRKYLEWLGVDYFPRLIKINGEIEYADFVMKNYDYKSLVDREYLKEGYKQFKELLAGGYRLIRATSIDDLDNILSNNQTEKIIQLLLQTENIVKILEKDLEPDTSKIIFRFNNGKSDKSISGMTMKSYLKWKIKNISWLATENNENCKPANCVTAAYITEDFQGLVEKPKIDYDVLIKNHINKDKIDYLFSLIGVHKTINTFSTGMLYSILNKLRDIDNLGEKAKTIYNQLAINYDDKLLDKLDKTDPDYMKFHNNGEVFCKNSTYNSIKDTYYLNDKRYGESIIKQFNIIEIDRRRGKEKIKKLFGVDPLDKIELNIEGIPNPHSLNSLFENEMEGFKPYVYVLRKEMDGGSEKNIIKDTKFNLVLQLTLRFLKDGNKRLINLNDYEYFYLKNRNTVFIKAPVSITDIPDLKEDIHFCSAIAEAFSAILDVDSQRIQIRELFSKTGNSRDELLRTELDDNNLQKLNDSRRILGITNNPKLEFWKSFVKCFKGKKIAFYKESDFELLQELKIKFPKFYDTINLVFNEINYQNLNEEISSEWIVKLFNVTGIGINQFNQFHYPSVDIKELYEINFKRALDRKKNNFKSLYYEKCLINDELKSGFLEIFNVYSSIQPTITNEVDYDVEKDMIEKLKIKFDIDILQAFNQKNLEVINQKNLQLFWELANRTIHEKRLFDQFISEDIIAQSLLYFEEQFNLLELRLKLWMGRNQENTSKEIINTKSKRIQFGNDTILYDNLTDLKNQIDSVLEIEGLKKVTSINIKTKATEPIKTENNKPIDGYKGIRKPKIPKEEIGFLGEYLVYRYLLDTLDASESVKWESAYARECGINMSGKDGLGYDIQYIPNGAKYPRYVEVKVVGWEDAFHISSNEVKYGEKYKKNYESFLVRNLENPTNAKIEKIQGLFDYKGKSFTDNDLFSVINDNYIIKFKKND